MKSIPILLALIIAGCASPPIQVDPNTGKQIMPCHKWYDYLIPVAVFAGGYYAEEHDHEVAGGVIMAVDLLASERLMPIRDKSECRSK